MSDHFPLAPDALAQADTSLGQNLRDLLRQVERRRLSCP
jgi:hypothetical protein